MVEKINTKMLKLVRFGYCYMFAIF